MIGHQITATAHRIDRLVYELYGLAYEEIEVVESDRTFEHAMKGPA